MVGRVDADLLVHDAGRRQGCVARPGHGGGEAEHAHDRRPEHGRLRCGAVPGHRVRGAPALAVGRAGEREGACRAGDRVHDLDGVADGPHVRVGRALVGVDADRSALAEREPGRRREVARGPHPDAHEHDVGVEDGAVRELERDGVVRDLGLRHDGARGGPEVETDAVVAELVREQRREVGLQRREHLVGALDDVDR